MKNHFTITNKNTNNNQRGKKIYITIDMQGKIGKIRKIMYYTNFMFSACNQKEEKENEKTFHNL